MKKILIVSTVSRQFYLFEQGNIEVLRSLGFEVHGAANFDDANERLNALDIVRHPIDIRRAPFSLANIKAYYQLKKLMKLEKFDAVHCHSPMGGALARLAAKSVGISPVIYTAHGFHFYKGAPLINWAIYYPIERFLSMYTDVLITINKEDYRRARGFRANKVVYSPGIGVDTTMFSRSKAKNDTKRGIMGISKDMFVMVSVGELNKNKNHEIILRAISKIDEPKLLYLLCGRGENLSYLQELAKSLGISHQIKFMGFRNDVSDIYQSADLFVLPSYREGLSVALMEAMASGLPCVVSRIRGNVDLIDDPQCLVEPDDSDGFAESIKKAIKDVTWRASMGLRNTEKIKGFSSDYVKKEMKKIYRDTLD